MVTARKRRVRGGLRALRRLFKPGPIGHTAKGVAYQIGNSISGLVKMRRLGKKRADRDTITTRDKVPVNTHWNRPCAHGFYDPAGKWTRLQRVDQSDSEDVFRLLSKKEHLPISSTAYDLHMMGKMGFEEAIIEAKSWVNMDNVAIWEEIEAMGKREGVRITVWALPGNVRVLPYAKAAGLNTKAIR